MAQEGAPTLYEVLGVAKDATSSQIKTAYYALAKAEHPDRKPDDPHATERFKLISRAYEVLKDTDKRQLYDTYGTEQPSVAQRFGLDPHTRLWIWCGAALLYMVFCTITAFTGVALEWFIPIMAHLALIYFHKELQKLDFYIWGATLITYLFLPSILVRKLASYAFATMLIALVNLPGVEIDLSIGAVFLTYSWETWMRTAPVHWPITAAYALPAAVFVTLACIGLYAELKVIIVDSLTVSHWNPFALILPGVFALLYILDGIGGFLTPGALVSWTMPLSWLFMLGYAIALSVWAVLSRSWRLTLTILGSAALGYVVVGPYFPSKIVSFVISVGFIALLTFSINGLQVGCVVAKWLTKSYSDVLYIAFAVACVIVDLFSGHHASLGSAYWIRLGGVLSALTFICTLFAIKIPSIAHGVATIAIKARSEEVAHRPHPLGSHVVAEAKLREQSNENGEGDEAEEENTKHEDNTQPESGTTSAENQD